MLPHDLSLLTRFLEPDPTKTRPWTDRTGTFSVDAQFIGLNDGKIHLHKQNGVKIAVPVAKMSVEDLEYVEKVTGESLDEDKPLSDIRRRSLRIPNDAEKSRYHGTSDSGRAGASVGASKQSDYDWFDLFLKAGVGPHQCERYAQNFARDSMDESVLPDITTENLRTLGLKEGDILRVMKHLDAKFNRTGAKSKLRNVSFGGEEDGETNGSGGLFSGPGGALRNNTRKGRPAPPVQANDVVDAKAFELNDDEKKAEPKAEPAPAPSAPADDKPVSRGFDDNAWEVKPPKQSAPSASAAPAQSQAPSQPALTGAMAELSLLTPPLQPTPTATQAPAQPSQPASQPQSSQPLQTQATGANPSFFAQFGPQQTGVQSMSPQSQTPIQNFNPQQTGFAQPQQQQSMPPRQRPQAPPTVQQGSLAPPPVNRPTSAPQNFQQQQNAFGPPPLQPQLTGVQPPQLAPQGQSLNDLNQQRFQQMHAQNQGMGQFSNGMLPQQTGYIQQQQTSSPFADPRPGQQMGFQPQPTGFGGFSQQQQPMQTGSVNSTLPPALQPQNTGVNGFGANNNVGSLPPVPPIPQQPTAAPLQPQKTGPAPPVRFGVKPEANKLAPQPTGLRANLSQASKFCPSNVILCLCLPVVGLSR